MYMEAIAVLTITHMQGYLPPPPTSTAIGETLWSLQYLDQEQDAMLQR